MKNSKTLAAIRRRSDEVISQTTDPTLAPTLKQTRAAELRGMLELVSLLTQVGVQVPSLVVGVISSEHGRVSQ